MRKRLLFLSILLLLTFNILVILNLNTVRVSAGEYPAIYIEPATTVDPNLAPGMNFTVSIYTNYDGSDVWAYGFTLSYNPDVLHGGINYADAWTGDGSTTEWNTTYPPHYDFEKVYVNSVPKTPRMQGNDAWIGDGSTQNYTTTGSPVVEDSEEVRVDSVLKTRETTGSGTWTGDASTTVYVTTQQPLKPGSDRVYVNNTLKTRNTLWNETWTGDGITTVYTTRFDPLVPDSEWVYVNNTLQQRDVNYTINYDAGTVTFTEAPANLTEVRATYEFGNYEIDYLSGTITFNSNSVPANLLEVRATYRYGHYEIDCPSGTITFFSNSVPGVGSDINALYTYKVYDIEYDVDPVLGWYATFKFAKPPGLGDDINVEYLYGGVDNGDLISGPYFGGFAPGFHNITEGKLKETSANLLLMPGFTVSGPGTLANVTFQVVGYGSSNITLGPETKLKAYASNIIDASIMPDHIQHGFFRNLVHVLASFTYSPEKPVVNESVTFNASASYDPDPDGEIVSYEWNFGDDNTTTTVNPIITHAYTAHGTYTVTLNVTDIENKADTTWDIVTVREHPVAYFTYSPAAPIVGETVTFNASLTTPDGGTITSYEWSFGDDNTTTTVNPIITHGYTAEGTYNVTLTITDSEGLTDITYDIVTVQEPPPSGIPWHLYMALAGVIVIVVVAIVLYFLRIRKPKPT